TAVDIWIGVLGLILVLEAARRAVGPALPILSLAFLAYAYGGQHMPDWLFPHRGYGYERVVAQAFLHAQGVFGVALKVMFTYVFLFVVFGALLEMTGATRFVIDSARRLLGGSAGGPAQVAILSSGLMGSLSGSAVANTAATGTFTIPLMRSGGFRRHQAAGIEAAASSGGALVPPVMGAGAYMMLEIIQPPVTYVEILRAAILPAILYYLTLFLLAHFSALRPTFVARRARMNAETEAELTARARIGARGPARAEAAAPGLLEGVIFLGSLGLLVTMLLQGSTVFRAVSWAMLVPLTLGQLSDHTRITPKRLVDVMRRTAKNGLPLIAAAACVGIIIGVVTLTGVGTKLPSTLLPLAEQNLFLALLLLMVSSIVLGMGLPSAVCYLLLATLVGPALGELGVPALAAHLFIFYFGLMSMVTPPVALAAYTAASIAGSGIMRTAFAAFRAALIGFILPFLFVYRPALLMLAPDGTQAPLIEIVLTTLLVAIGTAALAAALAGQLWAPLGWLGRLLLFAGAGALFLPVVGPVAFSIAGMAVPYVHLAGFGLLGVALLMTDGGPPSRPVPADDEDAWDDEDEDDEDDDGYAYDDTDPNVGAPQTAAPAAAVAPAAAAAPPSPAVPSGAAPPGGLLGGALPPGTNPTATSPPGLSATPDNPTGLPQPTTSEPDDSGSARRPRRRRR
ncbi:MAG: TRAP transporter fused permease subunit, partial [Acidobacteriota bacterium]